MMRFTHVFALGLAAYTLAGCGDIPDQAPLADEAKAEPSQPTPNAESAPDPQPEAEPDVAAPSVPDRFHGTWDLETGSCTPESDMRVVISANEIQFYESIGTVVAVSEEETDAALVTLKMEGEGEVWTDQSSLMIDSEGRLTMWPYKDGEPLLLEVPPMPRKRCT